MSKTLANSRLRGRQGGQSEQCAASQTSANAFLFKRVYEAISAARAGIKRRLQSTCAETAAMAEDETMADAPPTDAYGRLIGEAHTSGRLRGADMLDASEAASSLFALQQVLQRDDARRRRRRCAP